MGLLRRVRLQQRDLRRSLILEGYPNVQSLNKKKTVLAVLFCILALALAAFVGKRALTPPPLDYPPGLEHAPMRRDAAPSRPNVR